MSGKHVTEIVRGAGMFVNLVAVLAEEVVKAGGSVEMLYFTQKEGARPLMELLAKTIVESKLWRIPVSVIYEEIAGGCDDPTYYEANCKSCWYTYSTLVRSLTVLKFADNPKDYSGVTQAGIPQEIIDQNPRFCGDVVEFEGRKYAVVYFDDFHHHDRGAIFLTPDCFDMDS